MRTDVSPIDLLADPPRAVRVRFEVAAARIAERWLRRGLLRASREDFALAREFLVVEGWKIEELPGLYVQIAGPAGGGEPITREACVMIALRRLATRGARGWSAPARHPIAPSAAYGRAEEAPRVELSARAGSGAAPSASGSTA